MKKKRILIILSVVLLAALMWLLWGNITVGLTIITVTEEGLPAGFDGYRIAHVSDLHNSDLWEETIDRLKEADPDIICITGDLVDAKHTDAEKALAFAAEAVKLAPCYYIPGNHEYNIGETVFRDLADGLTALGVTVLLDEEVLLQSDGDTIALVGRGWSDGEDVASLSDFDGYRLLLSHYPEDFSEYVKAGYDLVLSGHAHGGQFRLPFIGGLIAPGQGFFPEYDSGMYSDGNTDMIVSRGIGNSIIPIRFNNRPEVILVELRCQ